MPKRRMMIWFSLLLLPGSRNLSSCQALQCCHMYQEFSQQYCLVWRTTPMHGEVSLFLLLISTHPCFVILMFYTSDHILL
nr:unnamed protein product [Callosobruchus chinensis]